MQSLLDHDTCRTDEMSGYCVSRVDSSGTICEQRGIFRTNCIDCLDRTNVVQSAIARVVLEIQVVIARHGIKTLQGLVDQLT